MPLNCRILKTRNAFESSSKEWTELLSRSASNSLFLQWEWQFRWWESFGGDLFIVLITEDDRTIAILPFIKRKSALLTILTMIGAPHSDYLDFIIEKGREKEVIRCFFNEFLNEHLAIKIIQLDSINQRSPNLDYLTNRFLHSFLRSGDRKKECPFIMLPDSWEAYLGSLSAGMRYFIGRKERKMGKDFEVQIGIAGSREEVSTRMDQFILQHQGRWNKRQRPGAFHSDAFCAFHKKVSEYLFKKGHLKLYYLELNKRPVASYYIFQYQNNYYFYLSGFDPDFSRYSPGSVLMGAIIKDAISQGMDEFDFMRGESDYKFKWTTRKRVVVSFSLVRKTPLAVLYACTDRILRRIALLIKTIFPSPIKEIFRKLLPRWMVDMFDPLFRE